MFLSMTGFGRSEKKIETKRIVVEIRSLNSKGLDIKIRSNVPLGDKEIQLRNIAAKNMHRGKVDVSIDFKNFDETDNSVINEELFKLYYHKLKALADELSIEQPKFLQAITQIPAVFSSDDIPINDDDWQDILTVFEQANNLFFDFRQKEGISLKKDLSLRANNILSILNDIPQFEEARINKLKLRLQKLLKERLGSENIDANRFEQEILYFLDKIDITEEKVRLSNHCNYFLERIEDDNPAKGRPLAFISQEMGREINTLGAKANSADIQVRVVSMKEELEKIKEQLLNVV